MCFHKLPEKLVSRLEFISDRKETSTPQVVSGNESFEVVIGNIAWKEFTLE
jgi:hypothetical protein